MKGYDIIFTQSSKSLAHRTLCEEAIRKLNLLNLRSSSKIWFTNFKNTINILGYCFVGEVGRVAVPLNEFHEFFFACFFFFVKPNRLRARSWLMLPKIRRSEWNKQALKPQKETAKKVWSQNMIMINGLVHMIMINGAFFICNANPYSFQRLFRKAIHRSDRF